MAAVQALYQWDLTRQAPEDIESHFIYGHDMAGADNDYFHHLVREVPRHLHELEDHFHPHLGREPDGIDPVERAILRMATYELAFQRDIPYRVVINEAVERAKVFGAEQGHRYVNGVLDKLARSVRKAELKQGR